MEQIIIQKVFLELVRKRALDIVRKYKQPILIFESVEEQLMNLPEEDKFNWQEIFELFHKPAVVDAEIEFGKVDEEKIKQLLVEKHDFSEDRINKQLEKLRKIEEESKQKGLEDWF